MAKISSLEEFLELVSERFKLEVDENDSLDDLDIDIDDFLEFLELDLDVEDIDRVSFEIKYDSKLFGIYDILFV